MSNLTDFDLYLFGEGTQRRAYEKLGAHLAEVDSRRGTRFAVWAPNARQVRVIGDFNDWRRDADTLRPLGNSGIWETFVPGAVTGARYKYAILGADGATWLDKADPYAFAAEVRPATASRVADLNLHAWRDRDWMERRAQGVLDGPVSIYEVHLGSWRRKHYQSNRSLTYVELAEVLPTYCAGMGFTHVELLPVTEYPLDESWGYQVTGYFAPTSRYGSPAEFMALVDSCHQAGLGVILDWVPAHFPRDRHGLAYFDGTHLYEHADPRRGEHPDWGTLIFNLGRHEVRSFLISSALFWLDRYHIDGLRVDAVASMLYLDYSRGPGQWLPNEHGGRENLESVAFFEELNPAVHRECPGTLMIAEESTAWPQVTGPVESGGLGFDLKWNMGWMHDTLAYMEHDPIYRRFHHNELTFSLVYAFSERYVLPLSHDEVVHGKRSLLSKMPGDEWQQFANLRLLLAFMFTHPGKKLLFMGAEIGQWREWASGESLDWRLLDHPGHQGLQRLVRDLNRLVRDLPALHEVDFTPQGFRWIDASDADNSVIAFERINRDLSSVAVAVCNFTPVVRDAYVVGVPQSGEYTVLLNTDDETYGGSGAGSRGSVATEAEPMHGRPQSVPLSLPPLGALVLQPR